MLKPFTNLGLVRRRGVVPAHGTQRQLPAAIGWADYSPCGAYRYTLGREYPPDETTTREGYMAWCMFRPHPANECNDDGEVGLCFQFGRNLGFSKMVIVNLFASCNYYSWFDADDKQQTAPVGPVNDLVLREVCGGAEMLMLAWGSLGRQLDRDVQVLKSLRTKWRVEGQTPRNLYALGILPPRMRETNQRTVPCHPLNQSYDPRGLPLRLDFDDQHQITGIEKAPL